MMLADAERRCDDATTFDEWLADMEKEMDDGPKAGAAEGGDAVDPVNELMKAYRGISEESKKVTLELDTGKGQACVDAQRLSNKDWLASEARAGALEICAAGLGNR